MTDPAKVSHILIELVGSWVAVGEIIEFVVYPASKHTKHDPSGKHNAEYKAHIEKPMFAFFRWWWCLLLLLRSVSIVERSPLEVALHNRIHASVCLCLLLFVLVVEIFFYLPLHWSLHITMRSERLCRLP